MHITITHTNKHTTIQIGPPQLYDNYIFLKTNKTFIIREIAKNKSTWNKYKNEHFCIHT